MRAQSPLQKRSHVRWILALCSVLIAASSAGATPTSLDDLTPLTFDQLRALFQSGATPRMFDLNGEVTGRVLAPSVIGNTELGLALVKALSGPTFPWLGKTFHPTSATTGDGYNRIQIAGQEFNAAYFTSSIGLSRDGLFDSLQVSYMTPQNLPLLWPLRDEIRQVGPGLWLGEFYLTTPDGDQLLSFFGLQQPAI